MRASTFAITWGALAACTPSNTAPPPWEPPITIVDASVDAGPDAGPEERACANLVGLGCEDASIATCAEALRTAAELHAWFDVACLTTAKTAAAAEACPTDGGYLKCAP